MSDFIKGLWPRSLFAWLGLIMGAMSVLALIQHGFNYGFGPTFTLLLVYYENLIHALIGWWAEPIIKAWLADLREWVGWDLHLYPHWKHVFVLMGVYFFRSAGISFRMGHSSSGAFRLLWGALVAFATSVATGLVVLSQSDLWGNVLIAAFPISGYVLWEFGTGVWNATLADKNAYPDASTKWQAFSWRMQSAVVNAFVGIAALVVCLQFQFVQHLPSPGLAMLGVLVLALALRWYLTVVYYGVRGGMPFAEALQRSAEFNVGASMLGVFISTAIFIAANAGLRFYGL